MHRFNDKAGTSRTTGADVQKSQVIELSNQPDTVCAARSGAEGKVSSTADFEVKRTRVGVQHENRNCLMKDQSSLSSLPELSDQLQREVKRCGAALLEVLQALLRWEEMVESKLSWAVLTLLIKSD